MAVRFIGFQTSDDGRNFAAAAQGIHGARIDSSRGSITNGSRETTIRAYPVSVEWPNRWISRLPSIETCRAAVRRRLGLPDDIHLAVGVDRLDYTKGIDEKFLAVERLLDTHPEFRARFAFVQIAEPSRMCIETYRALRSRVAATAARINQRSGTDDRPIVLLNRRHEPDEVHELLCAADVCYVGSLHDGMNLVAKEFVSARADERGVLILSEFAGASRELTEAVIVNPYDVDACAEALAEALVMPADEQRRRMRAMRSIVAQFNTYRWAADILTDAARLTSRGPMDRPGVRLSPLVTLSGTNQDRSIGPARTEICRLLSIRICPSSASEIAARSSGRGAGPSKLMPVRRKPLP